MTSPPLFCREDDSLEQALSTMPESRVYRLYVHNAMAEVSGVIAYSERLVIDKLYLRQSPSWL